MHAHCVRTWNDCVSEYVSAMTFTWTICVRRRTKVNFWHWENEQFPNMTYRFPILVLLKNQNECVWENCLRKQSLGAFSLTRLLQMVFGAITECCGHYRSVKLDLDECVYSICRWKIQNQYIIWYGWYCVWKVERRAFAEHRRPDRT